jgi:hypothetical protein
MSESIIAELEVVDVQDGYINLVAYKSAQIESEHVEIAKTSKAIIACLLLEEDMVLCVTHGRIVPDTARYDCNEEEDKRLTASAVTKTSLRNCKVDRKTQGKN